MSGTRYAILGDIHGNWEALSAVLEDAKPLAIDRYVSVGDLVGYNADPGPCMDRIRELECLTVRGNHDHYCSHSESLSDFHPMAASVIGWTRQQLTAEQVTYLRELDLQCVVDGFTLVHSTLDMPDRWGYVFDALEAQAHFNYQVTSLCFYGHTHQPMVFEKLGRVTRRPAERLRLQRGCKYFINVGSVGQPRDGDPRACYAILDDGTVRFRRVEYPFEETARKIYAIAELDDFLGDRLRDGR